MVKLDYFIIHKLFIFKFGIKKACFLNAGSGFFKGHPIKNTLHINGLNQVLPSISRYVSGTDGLY